MLFETELDYLWYANCYIKTTANPYIITEKEYYMVQNKLMKKYGIISDSTGLIVFLLAIHFVWELSYFQSFDFLLLEDLRMFNLNFNNIIGLDSRVMRIFFNKGIHDKTPLEPNIREMFRSYLFTMRLYVLTVNT